MLGKQKCRILKEIRQRIADENDIPYVTRECHFRGECKGSCPRCESELRYLEEQLSLRASMGKRIAVAALCAGMTLGSAGCTPRAPEAGNELESDLTGAVAYVESEPTPDPQSVVTTGEIAWPEETEEPCDTTLPPEESHVPAPFELMGDVAYPLGEQSND